jgi:hypothetical protein
MIGIQELLTNRALPVNLSAGQKVELPFRSLCCREKDVTWDSGCYEFTLLSREVDPRSGVSPV